MRLPGFRPTLLVAVSLAATLAAQAQELHRRPGLWETKTSTKSEHMGDVMARMQSQLDSLPPEQRHKTEQALARHGLGVSGGALALRKCLSREAAANDAFPQAGENCVNKVLSRAGNTINFTFTCTGPSPSSGAGEVVLNSATSFTLHAVADATVMGTPDRTETNLSGTWIADDCGSAKPEQPAPR